MKKYYKGYFETGYVTWSQKARLSEDDMKETIEIMREDKGINITDIEEITIVDYYADVIVDKIHGFSLSVVWAYLGLWIMTIVVIKPQLTIVNIIIPLGVAFVLEQLETLNRKFEDIE